MTGFWGWPSSSKDVMPYFYIACWIVSCVAQEGHELGGMRGWFRGLNKMNLWSLRMVIMCLYKYVKNCWLIRSGMKIIMPYFAFMDASFSIKHNTL